MTVAFPRRAPHLCIDQEDIDSREYDTISFIPALTLSSLCKNHFLNIHYENTPIQIYWKFHLQKLKIFR